jgi:hypothetical protein
MMPPPHQIPQREPPQATPLSPQIPPPPTINFPAQLSPAPSSDAIIPSQDRMNDNLLATWGPLVGIAAIFVYAFSSLGVVILCGVGLWYVSQQQEAKKKE